jgi:SecD/SecF fusion protein
VGVALRGRGLFDIDFTGGVSTEVVLNEPMPIADMRASLPETVLTDVTVQNVEIEGERPDSRFIINTSFMGDPERLQSDGETIPPEEQVKEVLENIFGDRLAVNELSYDPASIRTRATASSRSLDDLAPDRDSDDAAKEKQDKGKGDGDPSNEPGPDETGAYRADDEILLALADGHDPPETSSGESDAPSATKEANGEGESGKEPRPDETGARRPNYFVLDPVWGVGPSRTAAGESDAPEDDAEKAEGESQPADEKDDAAGQDEAAGAAAGDERAAIDAPGAGVTSTVELNFSQTIDHDTLHESIAAEVPPGAAFSITNNEYVPGSFKGFDRWILTIDVPAESTRAMLDAVRDRLAQERYFPSANMIGAAVAESTKVQAIVALSISVILTLIYIWFRFHEVSFGFAAVLAVVHDVLVALGALALSLWLAPYLGFALVDEFKINLPIIAAFLTIIGYSLNDTIVIFDRVREVRGKSPSITTELVNTCVNQTLSRTILTSLTVFIVVVILYIFGGAGIHGFAFTMVVGVVSGTYSTIYIATPILIWAHERGRTTPRGKTTPAAAETARAGS